MKHQPGSNPPPLPDESKPKRQRLDESMFVLEDRFLAQHSGPVRITVSVPNLDEGNLKEQLLEVTMQTLSKRLPV